MPFTIFFSVDSGKAADLAGAFIAFFMAKR